MMAPFLCETCTHRARGAGPWSVCTVAGDIPVLPTYGAACPDHSARPPSLVTQIMELRELEAAAGKGTP